MTPEQLLHHANADARREDLQESPGPGSPISDMTCGDLGAIRQCVSGINLSAIFRYSAGDEAGRHEQVADPSSV